MGGGLLVGPTITHNFGPISESRFPDSKIDRSRKELSAFYSRVHTVSCDGEAGKACCGFELVSDRRK